MTLMASISLRSDVTKLGKGLVRGLKTTFILSLVYLIFINSSVTSAVFYPTFVCLSVCLSVSNFSQKLLVGSSRKFY